MTTSPPKKSDDPTADETTALLAVSGPGQAAEPNEETLAVRASSAHTDNDVPLPRFQILLLCFARFIEPIAFFSIFPFVNQMIFDTGTVKQADVGFYSGLIESLFSLVQMLFMIPWGRAADRIGRKPILVASLCGMSIATCLFGLSTTIWQMMLFRCLAGVFAGTVVTVRAMISENSTPKTQARAFSFYAFAGNLGIFIGPLIGGSLAKPAEEFPLRGIFGRVHFFKQFPYVLSCFVVGVIGMGAAVICGIFLKETLVRKGKGEASPEPPMTTWELVKTPGVAVVLYLYMHVMLMAFTYTAIIPVFWFTDTELGGCGFSPFLISVFLGVSGLSQAVWLLLAFPPLQHRIGTVGVLRGCAYVWPFFFAFNPLCNVLLRHHWKVAFWATAPVIQILASGVAMAFTAVQLALNDISPSPMALATLNSLALALSSGVRALAPALSTSIFAIGVRGQILRGQLAWVIMIVQGVALIVGVRYLPKKAEGRIDKSDNRSD